MKKLRSGDEIIVIAGKNKGSIGKVKQILENDRILVEGINLVKKHQKPNPALQQQGGIVEKEAPLHISNVALLNPATGKADRVGIKIDEDGNKSRVFKSNGEAVN
jgi:large subunit ribosomal protein L24